MRQWLFGGRRVTGLIKSVQRGTIALTSATSATATITAVDPKNAELHLLGSGFSSNVRTGDQCNPSIVLTNSTTVTASLNTSNPATCTVSFEVIEYWPGVIRSIQRGTVAVGASATITEVVRARSKVNFLGFTMTSAVMQSDQTVLLALATATSVSCTGGGSLGQTAGFEVVEFN